MPSNSIVQRWGGKDSLVLAIGADLITCLPFEKGAAPEKGPGGKELSVPFRLPADGVDPTPALLLALEELRGKLPASGSRRPVRVILLPPISEGKLIQLPPLSREEAEQVVRTTAAQHFLRGGIPLVIGVEEEGLTAGKTDAGNSGDGEDTKPSTRRPVLAAAAPRAFADAVHKAVIGVGWIVDSIVPAHAAWLAAMRNWEEGTGTVPSAGAVPRVLVAIVHGTAHLLRLDGATLTRVRRLPATSSPAELLESAGAGPGRILVSADGEDGRAVLEAFANAGWHPARETHLAGPPALLAARHVEDTELEMVPPRLAMERRDRVRRIAVGMGIAAGVLFLASGILLLVGARLDLRSVRQYREELRPAVAPLLSAADSLFMIEDRVQAIEELEADAEGWALVLVELAVLLPEETHLERIRTAGDTLVLEATGGRAGEALEALRRSTSLADPRLEGTIQRDVEGGSATGERFTMSAIRKERGPDARLPIAEGENP